MRSIVTLLALLFCTSDARTRAPSAEHALTLTASVIIDGNQPLI
ncbi:hypothetical protein [Lysobacter gummosus]